MSGLDTVRNQQKQTEGIQQQSSYDALKKLWTDTQMTKSFGKMDSDIKSINAMTSAVKSIQF